MNAQLNTKKKSIKFCASHSHSVLISNNFFSKKYSFFSLFRSTLARCSLLHLTLCIKFNFSTHFSKTQPIFHRVGVGWEQEGVSVEERERKSWKCVSIKVKVNEKLKFGSAGWCGWWWWVVERRRRLKHSRKEKVRGGWVVVVDDGGYRAKRRGYVRSKWNK